jgi:DNA-binding MarR family transcriptional regulator
MSDNEPIGLLIGAVRRRIKQAVTSRARLYRLTPQQFWVMVALHERPGLALGQLAARLRMDEPTASRVVGALMNRQLVQVRGDQADRRRACLFLGAQGEPLAKELQELAAAVRNAVVDGLSERDQTALRTFLRRIIANMERFRDADDSELELGRAQQQ